MKHYNCPVCGYNQLTRPPKDYLICPSCGTEFGYDDFATTPEELRNEWIANGAHWFSQATLPPLNWNPITQLSKAGLLPIEPTTHVSRIEYVEQFAQRGIQVNFLKYTLFSKTWSTTSRTTRTVVEWSNMGA